MPYDQACYDLAESFLSDEPKLNTEENRKKLAQDIQTMIEDFIDTAAWEKDKEEEE